MLSQVEREQLQSFGIPILDDTMTERQHKAVIKTMMEINLFVIARDLLKEFQAEKQPMPWGKGQKYKSYVIPQEAIDRAYEEPDSPWLYGYMAYMQEFNELIAKAEIVPFVDKKRR